MLLTAAIMQPTYLPYLGYFELIAASELFVFLDDAQLEKQSWQTRNRIQSKQGISVLSLPLAPHGSFDPICQIELSSKTDWTTKHLGAIDNAYQKRPFFEEGRAFIAEVFEGRPTHLAEFTIDLTVAAATKMGLNCRYERTSGLAIDGKRSERLVNLCQHYQITDYLSPMGSRAYIEEEGVLSEAVKIHYRSHVPTPYKQQSGKGTGEFVPYMSFLDAVMNLGFAATGEMIRAGVALPDVP